MHNWKWMNLSKMAGLNISSRQSSNLAQLTLMSRSVFPLPFVFPTLYSFLHRQRNKQNYSTPISRMLFTFFRRKTLWKKLFSLHVCEAASAYKWQEFWHLTHTPLWLLIGRIIFLTSEKNIVAILIGRIFFFSYVKTIFAPLIGSNSFAYANLWHSFLVSISQYVLYIINTSFVWL